MKIKDLPIPKYFSSYPITDESEASWFSKRINLAIVDFLERSDPSGLTQEQVRELVSEKEPAGKSQVYGALRELYLEGKVGRVWDKTTNSRRYYLHQQWSPSYLDEDFIDWTETNVNDLNESILMPAFQNYVTKVMERVANKKSNMIPKKGKEGWCRNCGISHQAEKFFLALLYSASRDFVYYNEVEAESEKEKTRQKAIEQLYISNRFLNEETIQDEENLNA